MNGGDKITFPYETLSQAEKDRYKKIGGPDQAFRFLVKGFKSIAWRKRADANAKARDAEEDAAFEAEKAAEKRGPVRTPPPAPIPTPPRRPRKEGAA